MAYKLAIAISGAVSLGSYEAGVVYEIVNAIAAHNRHNAEHPERQVVIDVLSGASAGGMTATLLAQKLMFDGDALREPYNNVLYNAWVKEVDIEPLLAAIYHDDPSRSLLSSNFVRNIARALLLERYNGSTVTATKHPAAGASIALGLAMSNLNGVDYAVDAFKNAELEDETSRFTQTRYQDSFTRTVATHNDQPQFWQECVDAALGCGAFPTAFAPVKLERHYQELDYFGKAQPFNQAAFTYVDGGTFNNYPLGMAKNMVDALDTAPLDYERRFYLYISPNCKVSTRSDIDGTSASIFKTSGAILAAVFNQAQFQDWLMTSRFNNLIEQFDRRAEALAQHFLTLNPAELAATSNACELLLEKIFVFEAGRDQQLEFARLRARFAQTAEAQILQLHGGEAALHTWLKAVHVLEASGRLHDKDQMSIYTVTAANDELASDDLFAFSGFLDRRFREHDYNLGRRKAREFLSQLQRLNDQENGGGLHHLPLRDFSFASELPVLEDLGRASLADVDPKVRQQLAERLHKRINLWLKKAGMNRVLRFFVVLYLDKQIKKKLKL